jgi:hypothetical protein
MKKTLLTLAIAMLGYGSYAQYLLLTAGSGNPLTGDLYRKTTDFNTSTTTGSGVTLGLGTNTGNTYSFIQASTSGGTASSVLALNQYGGNVSIGTASPRSQFSVVSGTDNSGTFFPATNALIVGADNSLTSLSSNLAISSNSAAGADVGASIGFGGLWLGSGDTRDLEFCTIKGQRKITSQAMARVILPLEHMVSEEWLRK